LFTITHSAAKYIFIAVAQLTGTFVGLSGQDSKPGYLAATRRTNQLATLVEADCREKKIDNGFL
jgi:hypothetical protein